MIGELKRTRAGGAGGTTARVSERPAPGPGPGARRAAVYLPRYHTGWTCLARDAAFYWPPVHPDCSVPAAARVR
jgi:hypothetical protein